MKRFEAHQPYLVFMLIVSVFITILSGCGDGGGGGGRIALRAYSTYTGPTTLTANGGTGMTIIKNEFITFENILGYTQTRDITGEPSPTGS